jgi:tellurite resistance protein
MAAEICVADRQLAESEIEYLDGLQKELAIEEGEAKELFEAARKHSGLMTLEERSGHVRELLPAFVQCMAMMAAADDEIHHEERIGMRAVLGNIPDMAVLTSAELDEAIDVALERIAGKDVNAELAGVAKQISKPSDRYWTAVYVMIVALADGNTDWREVKFLENLKSTFELSENQMDVAMKTAAQFPAVDLGGHAPQ